MNDLTIYAYKTWSRSGQRIGSFKLQLNPINISVKKSTENITDDSKDASGNTKTSNTAAFQPAQITFKFTLDNTGVVSKRINNRSISNPLTDSIKHLQKCTVDPDNSTHKNPYVHMTWGKTFLEFNYGQVTALKYDYTFFDKRGNPLRAEVSMTVTEIEHNYNRAFQSPDITKMPTIMDKDNLVKYSLDHYDDKKYYIRIADYNNLASVRELKNGNQIILPPLEK
tara:strand:- start:156 stop:830 length:675 start_codon:yes stop_codon:yes gene_type:complete